MLSSAECVTAAFAFRQRASPKMVPITGSAPAHFRTVRRFKVSDINGLQLVHDILPAVFVAGARAVASVVQIDAVPPLVADLLQHALAGREIDIAIAKVVNAFEKLRARRILLF